MSYSSANDNFGKIVNQGIFTLLNAEIPREKVVYQPEFRKQDLTRQKYYRIYQNGSELVSKGTSYEVRSYNYQISYYYQFSGDESKKKFEDIISNDWEHLYFKLMSNRGYEPSSGYAWHDIEFGEVTGVIWGIDDEEKNVGHIDAEVSFTRCNQFEITEEIVIEGDIVIE